MLDMRVMQAALVVDAIPGLVVQAPVERVLGPVALGAVAGVEIAMEVAAEAVVVVVVVVVTDGAKTQT